MRYVPAFAFGIIIVGALALSSETATAGGQCPPSANRDACIAFLEAQISTLQRQQHTTHTRVIKRQHVVAPRPQQVRPKRRQHVQVARVSGQVCVHAQARGPESVSALVLYEGSYKPSGANTNVLKTWTGDGWFKSGGRWFKKICLDASLIADKSMVTLCNIDGHNVWSKRDIQYLLRVRKIGIGDPARLFGSGGA